MIKCSHWPGSRYDISDEKKNFFDDSFTHTDTGGIKKWSSDLLCDMSAAISTSISSETPQLSLLQRLRVDESIMTHRERMMACLDYNCYDAELLHLRRRAKMYVRQFQQCLAPYLPEDIPPYVEIVKKLMPNLLSPETSFIEPDGFQCDYGINIFGGLNLSTNTNVHIGDNCAVNLGRSIFIGPNTVINTAYHPLNPAERPLWDFSKEITIGDDCWLGAGVTILGGVTLGAGSVVAAGSIVNCDIPADSLVVGVPGRVIRKIGRDYIDPIKLKLPSMEAAAIAAKTNKPKL